jgi:hypothetical protein
MIARFELIVDGGVHSGNNSLAKAELDLVMREYLQR